MVKIAVIPIDNRPICYDIIQDILSINKDIKLFLPDISALGGLLEQSNVDIIFDFINSIDDIDYLIVSLDTIAYGGLVSSRRCEDSFLDIKKRIEKFKNIVLEKKCKVFAFSSIMRISNNNINEEEKAYWSQWGKRIFDWSYYLHKSEVEKSYNCVFNKIPEDILEDYLNTRKRNFEINKIYLNWAKEGFFDTLIFSKDDCAKYGLNVKEAQELEKIIKKENINSALIKTGADEIPLSLISRAINSEIKVNPIFLEENSIDLISKYEDISIKNCVYDQLKLAKCKIDKVSPDLNLIINNFQSEQGDLVLGNIINTTSKKIPEEKNFFIADANNANGADTLLIKELLNIKNIDDFYGYCGYNTSANTLGCAILCAIIKFISKKNNSYNDLAFKKFQCIRLVDDFLYQAKYRKFIREGNKNLDELKDEINKDIETISKFLNYYPKKITYSLPWNRSFEIRIKIED